MKLKNINNDVYLYSWDLWVDVLVRACALMAGHGQGEAPGLESSRTPVWGGVRFRLATGLESTRGDDHLQRVLVDLEEISLL